MDSHLVRLSLAIVVVGNVVVSGLGLCAPLTARAADTGEPTAAEADIFSPEQLRFFETQIRPLLAERCFKCHGDAKQQGGLRLDSREAILAGGELGTAATPGDADASLLVEVVGYQGDLKMPPSGKLSEREIAAVGRWVREGMAWPSDAAVPPDAATASTTVAAELPTPWSFQPVTDHVPPEVEDNGWCQSPLDRFVWQRLQAAGLRPAPAADRRTLIRRVKFDLLGLPPTPDEIESFVSDPSPEALVRLVDRLLDAPEYGQRWGRHWLDVARYADSNGQDENLAYVQAYRYRDYVVDAFNGDKPYDQFVREQVAGDLLCDARDEQQRYERLIATGFLVLGPKMLAEDDPVKMEMDIVDEQVDAMGGAFLGLTLGCARCHDHKFDPITIRDYYALAGIFKSTQTMDNFKVVAQWHERPLAGEAEVAAVAAHRAAVDAKKSEIAAQTAAAGEEDQHVKQLKLELEELEKSAPPELPYAMAVDEATPVDLPIHLRGSHLHLGEVVARGVPQALQGETAGKIGSSSGSGRLELADWLTDAGNPLVARVMVNRLWRWHFGAGLVRSTDNFGNLGQPPSHPELLDWLATRFVESGYSVKAMHRLIMSSSTYQMSAAYDAAAAQVDPDNRLLWRMNRRRLEAEAVRDALLFVAGELDTSPGGTLLETKPRAYVTGTASTNATRYSSPRRSLYLPVVRSALYEPFQAFDFAEPTTIKGDRDHTTVSSQALFMMNGEIMHQTAAGLAAQLISEHGADPQARVRWLYATALGRYPTAHETARALRFVEEYQAAIVSDEAIASEETGESQPPTEADPSWQALCRVVLSSSEFLYVE